jgi:hypothetical protein
MLQHWLLREPSLCFGLPVYLFAAFLFPLHLGWVGTSPGSFVAYLVAAAILFSIADAIAQPAFYRRRGALVPQSFLSLLAIGVPAALAFAAGAALGPVDEAMDEEFCAAQGTAELDSVAAEADDTYDVTADCAM